MKKEIIVVGAVITRDNLVLAAQRSATMSLPGMWEFPGGKIEPGETEQEALVREIDEELGAEILVGERITSTRHEYDFGFVTLTTFYATLMSESIDRTEHSELRWVTAEEMRDLDWAPADIPAIELIIADLSQ